MTRTGTDSQAHKADLDRMHEALALARQAGAAGEVPVGAVVVAEGRVIGRGANRPIADCDASAHAEVRAIRAACAACANYRLPGATLYATLEPCAMCAGAIIQARIARVVYAATDPRAGAVDSVFRVLDEPRLNHRVEVTSGVAEAESVALLRAFFRARRSA